MKEEIKKFLEFNGKSIYFLSKDGQYWIAIKPICEALNIPFNRHIRNLTDDEILNQVVSNQTLVAADGKLRKMVCLPEKFIYGWIFSINSSSEELIKYKKECYEVLFNHFHGSMTQRSNVLETKTKTEIELEKLEAELLEDEKYQRFLELKKQKSFATKELNALDQELVKRQLPIWSN